MICSCCARRHVIVISAIAAFLLAPGITVCVRAQDSNSGAEASAENITDLKREAADLRALLDKLQKRIDHIETSSLKGQPNLPGEPPVQVTPGEPSLAKESLAGQPGAPPSTSPDAGLLGGTTVNLLLDTYYENNFNDPIGRANLLRAYDVTSNTFALNQAALVLENAPKPEEGKRWGARVDLQWGQATQTLQGNPANEPRSDIYRALFQAYGTYVAPVGRGLTIDFGKWASSLGMENNYTKDQMNYSRSYWFDYLPFYHMGVRVNYNFSDQFGVHYWITNGTQQTEDFNGFKDQGFGFVWQANKAVNWSFNYYLGQEHPDVVFYPAGTPPGNLPTLQGVPFNTIPGAPTGKLHIFDSYVSWQASPLLTLAMEADWVIERDYSNSAPAHTDGGAVYARYQLKPKLAMAARAEYLSDRGGLFSGTTQALKETTFTLEYKLAEAFLLRWEWRRDFSNQPYFYTSTQGLLKRDQNTAGVGLVWWFGGKTGPW